jgi:hypothetical protein
MEEERAAAAKDLIQSIRKSKKLLQIYPPNNAIYRAAVKEVCDLTHYYLDRYGDIVMEIRPEGLFVDSGEIYRGYDESDNFSLFLLKEGVREISILKGIESDEIEDFLRVIGIDFNKKETVDDLLTVAWEEDFEHIKMVADELFSAEDPAETADDSGRHAGMASAAGAACPDPAGTGEADMPSPNDTADERLRKARSDGLMDDEFPSYSAPDLDVAERATVMARMNQDQSERIAKLSEILVYLLLDGHYRDKRERVAGHMRELIGYGIGCGLIDAVLAIVKRLKNLETRVGLIEPPAIGLIKGILLFCVSPAVISRIGSKLDTTKEIPEERLREYVSYFGRDAVRPLIGLLKDLQTIHARHVVNNALIGIGAADIDALIEGLSAPHWYVVRNIICVLRGIGNIAAAQRLMLKLTGHEHPRVRLEALKSLQETGKDGVLQVITRRFDDESPVVRLGAIAVMGNIAREQPAAVTFIRKAIMDKIGQKVFAERDFGEKKAFHEALVYAGDRAVEDHMLAALKSKGLFPGRKHIEAKACAAHYLGLSGSRAALPVLDALAGAADPLLAEYSLRAAQRIRS